MYEGDWCPSITEKWNAKYSSRVYYYLGKLHLTHLWFGPFNKTHLWFKTYHLTHISYLLLDTCYPPLPFSLENPLYYISQNYNPIRTPKKKIELSPFLYIKIPKIPIPIIPFSLYFDCQKKLYLLYWLLARRCTEAWVFLYIRYEMILQGLLK